MSQHRACAVQQMTRSVWRCLSAHLFVPHSQYDAEFVFTTNALYTVPAVLQHLGINAEAYSNTAPCTLLLSCQRTLIHWFLHTASAVASDAWIEKIRTIPRSLPWKLERTCQYCSIHQIRLPSLIRCPTYELYLTEVIAWASMWLEAATEQLPRDVPTWMLLNRPSCRTLYTVDNDLQITSFSAATFWLEWSVELPRSTPHSS